MLTLRRCAHLRASALAAARRHLSAAAASVAPRLIPPKGREPPTAGYVSTGGKRTVSRPSASGAPGQHTPAQREIHQKIVGITRNHGLAPPEKLRQLTAVVDQYGTGLSALNTVTMMNGFVGMKTDCPALWSRLSGLLQQNEPDPNDVFASGAAKPVFQPRDASQLLYAAGRLGRRVDGANLARHLSNRPDFPASFNARDMSSILWSLGKLELNDDPSATKICDRFTTKITDGRSPRPFEEYSTTGLCQILTAFTQLPAMNQSAVSFLLDELIQHRSFSAADEQKPGAPPPTGRDLEKIRNSNAHTMSSILQTLETRFSIAEAEEKTKIREFLCGKMMSGELADLPFTPQGIATIVKAGVCMDVDLFTGTFSKRAAEVDWSRYWVEFRTLLYALTKASRSSSNLTGTASGQAGTVEIRDFLTASIQPLLQLAKSGRLDPNLASIALWTYASHRLHHPELIDVLVRVPKKTDRDISLTVWSIAVLKACEIVPITADNSIPAESRKRPLYLQLTLDAIRDRVNQGGFKCWKSLLSVGWALSVLEEYKLLESSVGNIAQLHAQTLSENRAQSAVQSSFGSSFEESETVQLAYISAALDFGSQKRLPFAISNISQAQVRLRPSNSQATVVAILQQSLGLEVQIEYALPGLKGLCTVDMHLPLPSARNADLLQKCLCLTTEEVETMVKKRGIVIEVDGPRHFLEHVEQPGFLSPIGASLLREKLVRRAGFHFVSLSVAEMLNRKSQSRAQQMGYVKDCMRSELKRAALQ